MFLSAVNGRYWVEVVDQVTADWESLRMNHGIAKVFREAMRSRTVVPSVVLASARFFSLRTRNADPVSTTMTLKGQVQIGLGWSNGSPFPEFVQDYNILANHLGVEFTTSCYPHRPIGFIHTDVSSGKKAIPELCTWKRLV
jgi:hypothetical protein